MSGVSYRTFTGTATLPAATSPEGVSRYVAPTVEYSSAINSGSTAGNVPVLRNWREATASDYAPRDVSPKIHVAEVRVRQYQAGSAVIRSASYGSSIPGSSLSTLGAPRPYSTVAYPSARVSTPCGDCGVARYEPPRVAYPCGPCGAPRALSLSAAPAPVPARNPCRPCEAMRAPPPVPCGAPGTPCELKARSGGYVRVGNEYFPAESPQARGLSTAPRVLSSIAV